MPWQHFSFQIFGPPKILGRAWAPDLGPGRALAGLAKIEGLEKVKYGGLDFSGPQMENRHQGSTGMGLGMAKT